MSEDTAPKLKLHSHHALLALLGQRCQQLDLLQPFHQLIHLDQKTIIHSPTHKLQDALVGILMGHTAFCQINTSLTCERALWQSWGRTGCADQSTIQRTLEACTSDNVKQLQQVNARLLQKIGRSLRHDYAKGPLVLDGDLTGLPCSKSAEGASTGYFADCPPGTTGRQLFRFSAADYNEIIYEQVFAGNTPSSNLANFKQVLNATFKVLGLQASQKPQVLVRLDGGFGTSEIINFLLAEGYQFVVKLYSSSRALKLCRDLQEEQWLSDPKQAGREAAVLNEVEYYPQDQQKQLIQLGVRCVLTGEAKAKKKVKAKNLRTEEEGSNRSYSYHVLVVQRPSLKEGLGGEFKAELVLGQLAFYDKRATIESASFCGDKQGLGLARRRKHSLAGQEMLIGLGQMAHNLIVWQRYELSKEEPKIAEYGIKCWVRDWLGLGGRLTFKGGQIVKVRLPLRHELTRQFESALGEWASQSGARLILRQT